MSSAVARQLPSTMFLTTQWNRQCVAAFSGEKCCYRYWSNSGISVKLIFMHCIHSILTKKENRGAKRSDIFKTRCSINFFDISCFYAEASSWILCSTLKGELLDQKLNFWVFPVKKKNKTKKEKYGKIEFRRFSTHSSQKKKSMDRFRPTSSLFEFDALKIQFSAFFHL